jgi:hypothetical protein
VVSFDHARASRVFDFGETRPCRRSDRLFGRAAVPNTGNPDKVTDGERLRDITQKLRDWGYLSHFPDAERDVAWLLEQLAERDARIAELERTVNQTEWILSLP